MKREYDFSKGERGKFYRQNVRIHLPIYLDEEILEFVEKIAKKKYVFGGVKETLMMLR
jgi:hypothetical protein